jgi:hypothetical protein
MVINHNYSVLVYKKKIKNNEETEIESSNFQNIAIEVKNNE